MPYSGFTDYTVDVSGIISVGWDTTQFADSPSFLSEMVVRFGSTSA